MPGKLLDHNQVTLAPHRTPFPGERESASMIAATRSLGVGDWGMQSRQVMT